MRLNLPVVSSNMKNITGPKMAATIAFYGGLGLLHRFCTINENIEMYKKSVCLFDSNFQDKSAPYWKNIGVSIGVKEEDKERFEKLYEAGAHIFCIDVAHGHHIHVKKMLQWIRNELFRWGRHEINDIVLIAGNIATADAYKDLSEWGANVIKVGIGPSCFVSGSKVKTYNGYKNIEDITSGDMVLTHTGKYEQVTTKFEYDCDEEIVHINDELKCTCKHEIYVIHKSDLNKVTEDNFHKYAKWIAAENLTPEYFMIEIV